MKTLQAAAIGLTIFAAPALAQDRQKPADADSMMGMMTMRPGMEMSEADRGDMKAMQAMRQSMMKTAMTGDASGDFVRMMIPHHQSAVDMVDVLLAQKDVDPEIKEMAGKMKKDQTDEIGKLQKWLDARQKLWRPAGRRKGEERPPLPASQNL